MKPKIVAIDGNIGVGKTNLLELLRKKNYTVFEEPIGLWQPLLELQQHDRSRWTFTLQMYALAHFIQLQKTIETVDYSTLKGGFIFIERFAASSKVFTKTAYDDGVLTELEFLVWNSVYDLLATKPDVIFFLKAPIDVYLARIKKRGRVGEESLDFARLSLLERNYELIYQDYSLFILDGEQTQESLLATLIEHLKTV